jgi:hypothetical protein
MARDFFFRGKDAGGWIHASIGLRVGLIVWGSRHDGPQDTRGASQFCVDPGLHESPARLIPSNNAPSDDAPAGLGC